MGKKKSSLLVKYLNIYRQKPKSRVFAPLAESYRKLGMLDEALKILADGLTHNPHYTLGHLVLANCYYDQKKYQKSFETLIPFVEENIENISLQKLFANTCLKVGKLDEALQTFKYIMFLNPKDQDVIRKVKALEDDLRVSEPTREDDISYKELYPDDWVEVSFPNKHSEQEAAEDGREENFTSSSDSQEDEDDQWSIEKSRVSEVFRGKEEVIKSSVESEKSSKNKPVEARPIRPAPVITHTLVDLYCAQEHFGKAREILEKILELNPDDEKSLRKLQEIDSLQNRNNYEEAEHEKLLNYIESKVKNKDPQYQKISEKFSTFLNALRAKASAI